MKFQNCILINFERMHGRTDGRKEGHTDKPKAICPFNFSKAGGIMKICYQRRLEIRSRGSQTFLLKYRYYVESISCRNDEKCRNDEFAQSDQRICNSLSAIIEQNFNITAIPFDYAGCI